MSGKPGKMAQPFARFGSTTKATLTKRGPALSPREMPSSARRRSRRPIRRLAAKPRIGGSRGQVGRSRPQRFAQRKRRVGDRGADFFAPPLAGDLPPELAQPEMQKSTRTRARARPWRPRRFGPVPAACRGRHAVRHGRDRVTERSRASQRNRCSAICAGPAVSLTHPADRPGPVSGAVLFNEGDHARHRRDGRFLRHVQEG